MERSIEHIFEGTYSAVRASALSGVPERTIYYWASKDIVTPSISQVRERLWSYGDLMVLRIVYWLRHPKEQAGREFAASQMTEVRRALEDLASRSLNLWNENSPDQSPLRVDSSGKIFIEDEGSLSRQRQEVMSNSLDLLGPFVHGNFQGPDLRRPRPHLRIVPGKCSGEPHLKGSRITTLAIAALSERGYDDSGIQALYPTENLRAIREAVELERSLAVSQAA